MFRAESLEIPVGVARAAARLMAALLVAVALLGTITSSADAAPTSVVLAVEGAELLGPDPIERTEEDNPARELGGYEDRDVPFTWGAAWLLTFLGVGGLATMGLVYWFRVERPGRAKAPARR
jgi:hypothetical protein